MNGAPLANLPCWTSASTGDAATEQLSGFPVDVVDVVVVGGGLAGCTTALHLTERRPDLTVVVVEAGRVAAGASGRGTGLLGPRIGPPVETARRRYGDDVARGFHRASERMVDDVLRLAARCAPQAVQRCRGQLVTGFTPRGRRIIERRARTYAELGLDVGVVAARSAALPAPAEHPALWYRTAAGVDPAALTRGLASAARQRGATLVQQAPVRALRPAGGGLTRLVTTGGGILARAVVLAVDGAGQDLGMPTGDLLHLEVCAQATAPLPRRLLEELGGPGAPHVLDVAPLGAYRRFTPDGRLVIGGGPALPCHGAAPDVLRSGRSRAWAWQRTWLEEMHPALIGAAVEHRWSGRITVTRDGLPVLARLDVPGEVWTAGGWNGHGLAATNAAGQVLADSVLIGARAPVIPSGEEALWQPTKPWVMARDPFRPAVRVVLAAGTPRSAPRPDRGFLAWPRGGAVGRHAGGSEGLRGRPT